MAKHNSEYESRSAAFLRANGTCECSGVGCDAPTHKHAQEGTTDVVQPCTERVAVSGEAAAEHSFAIPSEEGVDPLYPSSWMIYCRACKDQRDAAGLAAHT